MCGVWEGGGFPRAHATYLSSPFAMCCAAWLPLQAAFRTSFDRMHAALTVAVAPSGREPSRRSFRRFGSGVVWSDGAGAGVGVGVGAGVGAGAGSGAGSTAAAAAAAGTGAGAGAMAALSNDFVAKGAQKGPALDVSLSEAAQDAEHPPSFLGILFGTRSHKDVLQLVAHVWDVPMCKSVSASWLDAVKAFLRDVSEPLQGHSCATHGSPPSPACLSCRAAELLCRAPL